MALKTISSFQLTPNWRYGGTTAKLRLYYSEEFVDDEQRPVIGGALGSQGFYDEVEITIAGNVATVASFQLVTTEDSSKPNVKVSGVLYDSTTARRETIFEWSVPSNEKIPSPAIFGELDAYNRRNTIRNPIPFYQTQEQVTLLINARLAALGLGPATDLALGTVLLSIAATDPAQPKVWGHNDPLVRDALKLMGIPLDALMASPADTNVPVFDAVSGTWKPGVGAQGAAGGDLSGTYPNPEVVDDSHSHSAATLTSLPDHAATHENNGADEISVAGLSGVLADPQVAGALLETSGPTLMVMGDVGDGEFLKRDGPAVVGATSPGGPATQIEETSGPTVLDIAAIADGEFLKRSGATVIGATSPGGGVDVEDEGTPVATFTTLNFTGAGVTATDAGGGVADITIPGGAGARLFQFEFDGRGTAIDSGTIPQAVLPFSPIAGTITEAYVKDLDVPSVSGSCTFDVRAAPRGSATPGPGESLIGAGTKPGTSSSDEGLLSDLSSWTSDHLDENDEVIAVIVTNSDHKHLMLVLTVVPD